MARTELVGLRELLHNCWQHLMAGVAYEAKFEMLNCELQTDGGALSKSYLDKTMTIIDKSSTAMFASIR